MNKRGREWGGGIGPRVGGDDGGVGNWLDAGDS